MTATTSATDPAQIGLERSRRLVLPECLGHNARRHPERIALVFEDQTLTFAELDERANRLANALASAACAAATTSRC